MRIGKKEGEAHLKVPSDGWLIGAGSDGGWGLRTKGDHTIMNSVATRFDVWEERMELNHVDREEMRGGCRFLRIARRRKGNKGGITVGEL